MPMSRYTTRMNDSKTFLIRNRSSAGRVIELYAIGQPAFRRKDRDKFSQFILAKVQFTTEFGNQSGIQFEFYSRKRQNLRKVLLTKHNEFQRSEKKIAFCRNIAFPK
jgi:hypothetical protein